MATNTIISLVDFFSTPEKPVTYEEYMEFRNSLTPEEVWYYATVSLAK